MSSLDRTCRRSSQLHRSTTHLHSVENDDRKRGKHGRQGRQNPRARRLRQTSVGNKIAHELTVDNAFPKAKKKYASPWECENCGYQPSVSCACRSNRVPRCVCLHFFTREAKLVSSDTNILFVWDRNGTGTISTVKYQSKSTKRPVTGICDPPLTATTGSLFGHRHLAHEKVDVLALSVVHTLV